MNLIILLCEIISFCWISYFALKTPYAVMNTLEEDETFSLPPLIIFAILAIIGYGVPLFLIAHDILGRVR